MKISGKNCLDLCEGARMGCFNYYCVLFCWFVAFFFLLPKFRTAGVHRLMSGGRKESS